MELKTCYICGEKAKVKGLCEKHYKYAMRRKLDLTNKELVKDYINKNYLSRIHNLQGCYICLHLFL